MIHAGPNNWLPTGLSSLGHFTSVSDWSWVPFGGATGGVPKKGTHDETSEKTVGMARQQGGIVVGSANASKANCGKRQRAPLAEWRFFAISCRQWPGRIRLSCLRPRSNASYAVAEQQLEHRCGAKGIKIWRFSMIDKTIYEAARRSGMCRRDFVKFCTLAAANLGLQSTMVPHVVKALETKPRPAIYWLNFAACTCCTESLIKSSHPLIADAILGIISLDYMETIQTAAGHQAEEILWNGIKENAGNYLLAVEGSVPTKDGGIYCTVGGMTAIDYLHKAAAGTKAIVSVGSCASFGCVTTAHPNPTGCRPIHRLIKDKLVVNLPGCPPIADVLAGTIVHLVTFDQLPELDALHRPKVFYGQRIHDKCYRRAILRLRHVRREVRR